MAGCRLRLKRDATQQKPNFVFRRNGRIHLNRRGTSVQSTAGSRGVRNSGSNAGYTVFRGSVKSTGHPLHSPVSPFASSPVRHRVPSHFNWDSTTVDAAHLGCQQSTELTPPADLNALVRFAERRNLVPASVPSHFNWPLLLSMRTPRLPAVD